MKTHKNLFDQIITRENFYNALRSTSKGKRNKFECLAFLEKEYSNIELLRNEIINDNYLPAKPTRFAVYDPKPRTITALQFRDRIVQHAIYSILYPIFNKTFMPNSYACRKGYGSHRTSRDVQARMRKSTGGWYLKTDFSKYFHRIDRHILWKQIERKVGCYKTLSLIEKFIPRTGVGLNIGELLSQLFANVIGNVIDHFIKHELKIKYFFRYMDDIVIFGETKEHLSAVKQNLQVFCEDMGLTFSKWFIHPISSGINFVGYRIWSTHKLIRKDSINRAKRKLRRLKGTDRIKFINSWTGHLQHADTYNLKKRMGLVDEILL